MDRIRAELAEIDLRIADLLRLDPLAPPAPELARARALEVIDLMRLRVRLRKGRAELTGDGYDARADEDEIAALEAISFCDEVGCA